jgi:hypothetical protein
VAANSPSLLLMLGLVTRGIEAQGLAPLLDSASMATIAPDTTFTVDDRPSGVAVYPRPLIESVAARGALSSMPSLPWGLHTSLPNRVCIGQPMQRPRIAYVPLRVGVRDGVKSPSRLRTWGKDDASRLPSVLPMGENVP